MTASTSVVFPKELGPGTWWYRVRGFDYSLPTGAQQMSWSDPASLVVATPKFKLVGGSTTPPAAAKKPAAKTAPTNGLRTQSGTGFTIGVPTSWARQTIKDSVATFVYRSPATKSNVVELTSSGRGSRTMAQWAADLEVELRSATNATPTVSYVTLPAGKAIRLSLTRTVGTTKIVQVQYVVDGGPTAYNFTFTTTSSRAAADLPVFARMIASLRLTS
jgi:hypothetical protein